MNYTTYIKINTNNLIENINYIKNKYNYDFYILDVSNNAFNHGMYLINALKNNIDYLYVNTFQDIILIRKYNKEIPIIYNGEINENNIHDLILNNTILIIKKKTILENILNSNIKDNFNILLNIDINNYNGINSKQEILNILDLIKDNKYINILGLKAKINEKEYEDFKYIISPLKNMKLFILNDEEDKNKIKLSNSIKLDKSLYGINDNKKLFIKNNDTLKQIFSLNTKIISINKITKNKKEIYQATIPIGYLNGLINKINKVYINNKLYNIIKSYEYHSLIEIDETINLNNTVEITSFKNPLNNYLNENILLSFNLFNANFPIIYDDYILEKNYTY